MIGVDKEQMVTPIYETILQGTGDITVGASDNSQTLCRTANSVTTTTAIVVSVSHFYRARQRKKGLESHTMRQIGAKAGDDRQTTLYRHSTEKVNRTTETNAHALSVSFEW